MCGVCAWRVLARAWLLGLHRHRGVCVPRAALQPRRHCEPPARRVKREADRGRPAQLGLVEEEDRLELDVGEREARLAVLLPHHRARHLDVARARQQLDLRCTVCTAAYTERWATTHHAMCRVQCTMCRVCHAPYTVCAMHHAMHYVTRLPDAVALQEGKLHLGEGLLPHEGGVRLARPAGAQRAKEGDGVAQQAEPRVDSAKCGLRRTWQPAGGSIEQLPPRPALRRQLHAQA